MIKKHRKIELDAIAQDIVNLYPWEDAIFPELILEKNGVQIIYDDYDSEFEGLTTYRNDKFHVHINTKAIPKGTLRSRFTLAHETAHYIIPEHNLALQKSYHPSKFSPQENNLVEQEANFFAAALLMPKEQVIRQCSNKKFSLKLVDELSRYFKVSKLAVVLRMVDLDFYPLMVSFSQNQMLKWLVRSEGFPFQGAYRSKYGEKLPYTSVVGEYYRLSDAKYTGVERIQADDWFYLNHGTVNLCMNEQCFYSHYGYVLSMVWPD